MIADNDNTKEGTAKYKRKEHLKDLLGDNFYELPVTEIENLLPQKTIEQILIKQNPSCVVLIKEKFAEERNYKNLKLGSYLDNKLFRGAELRKYSSESGAIKNKLVFCQAALEHLTDYDMLTNEAKALVESIVVFVRANN